MKIFTLKQVSFILETIRVTALYVALFLGLFTISKAKGQTNSFIVGSIIGTTGDFARNAKIADFDNDGDNDIAFYSDGANYRLYKNSGTGTFANTYTELIPYGSAGGIIEAGDLDNDGDIDIVATNGRVYINNGSGTFTQLGTLLIQQNTGGGIAAIKIIDINNDGKKDIIWSNNSNGTNAYNEVWLNTGTTGSAAFTYSTRFAPSASGMGTIDVGDIDGDGDLDVVIGINGGSGNSVDVFKNTSGTFTNSQVGGTYASKLLLNDWDKDGDLDLITWSTYNGAGFKVFLNNGSGTFGTSSYIGPIVGSSIDFGDLNGDGYLDAAISNGTGGTTSLLINKGCGLVEVAGVAVAAPHGIVLGDVSGDGKLDLFIMSRYNTTTNQSRVYLNDLSLVSIKTVPGNALNFDGTDDYVSIPDANSLDLTSSYTIEAWIKPTSFSAAAGIVSKYHTVASNGYLLRLAGTAPYTGINFDGLETATGILEAGKWYHIAAVKSGATRTLYINGVAVAMPNGSAITTAANTDVLTIGVDYLASPRYFNGSIDEVRIWNTARTPSEITTNNKISITACSNANLVAYYKLDNGTASGNNGNYYAANDLSTNNNNGILTNFSLATGATSNWVESYAMVVPTVTAATNISATGFTANWAAPASGTVTNYLLDVSTSSSFSSFVSGYNGLSVSGTSQAVTGLSAATSYYYRVRADKTSVTGQGAYSSTITALTSMQPPGNALNSDGANDRINGVNSNLPQGNAARTIETWVKNSAGNDMTIFNYGDPAGGNNQLFALHLYNGVYIIGQYNDIATNYNINDGKWHHLAITHDGTTTKIYVDGNLINSTAKTYNTTGTSFQIASMDRSGYRFFFNGTLDEMRVWNTARTQAEIQANMYRSISASSTGLIAYYNFDIGTAGGTNTGLTTLTDQSSSAANGTLTNFALTGASSNWVASTAFGNTWLGATSNAFDTTTNWSFGTIPLATDNIYIPSGVSNMPIIAGTQGINNLDIQSGASLTVTGTLKIGGSITNSGTLTATSGTVELNGSTAQTIPANAFTSNTVQNLTINNSAGVSLGGALNVTGVLTPTAGVLTTGGNLTLASSATGTASIAAGAGTYLSGTVNVQRYSQAQRGYRAIANPYTTAQSISQLTDNFQVTGLTSGALGTYGLSTGNPSAFIYDGTQAAGSNGVLASITNSASTVWGVGKGLYVFVRGNGNEGTGGNYTSSGGVPSPVTLDVTNGTINQGNVTVSLTPYAAGQDNFTLVANPYPCPINLSGVTGISSFGTIYLYNPIYSAGASTILRGGFESTSSNNIIIPSMGCFYIQSTATTPSSITFHESDKVTSGTPSYTVFGTGNAIQPKLVLQLSTTEGFMDKTTIALENASSNSASDFHDALKLQNNLANFYTLSSNQQALAIDYRADLNTAIPLGIQTTTATTYKISLSELTDLPNTQLVLRDKLLKTETILSQVGDGYSFSITADTATKGDNRFEIGLLGTTVLPVQIADITAQLLTTQTVAVNWTSTTEVNLASYNIQRSKDGSNFTTVGTVAAKGVSAYSYNDDLSTVGVLPSTIYYRLEALDKDGSKTYGKVVSCQLSVASKSISIHPNPVQATLYAQVTVTKAGSAQLSVKDAQGKVVVTQKTQLAQGTTSISLPVSQLLAGSYVLEIESTNGKQTERFILSH